MLYKYAIFIQSHRKMKTYRMTFNFNFINKSLII